MPKTNKKGQYTGRGDAPTTPPGVSVEPDQDEPGTDPIQAIFQAIGHASMCWEHPDRAGVFDEAQATSVASGLIDELRRLGVIFP